MLNPVKRIAMHAPTAANGKLFGSAIIQWQVTYTCNGYTYHTGTPQHGMPCLATI